MPPRKREKDPDAVKTPRIDHIQADHELFLQAFEKPTQIYRYLRTRNMCLPIFLNRTLTYMKHRMSRNNKGRQGFKVDSLLEKVLNKKDTMCIQPGYINLTFLGFNNKSLDYDAQIAQVETVLLKISHKKRKDSSAPSMQVTLGTADVPINPNEQDLPLTAPTISIPTESFNPSSGPLVKSYILLFRVKVTQEKEFDDEPASKKRKSNNASDNSKLYGAELTVYDKHNRCYLSDGDYDIVVQDFSTNTKNSIKKHSSWENVNDLVETCGNLDAFMKGAVLKFKLNWSPEASAKIVDRPQPYPLQENKENLPQVTNMDTEKLQIVYQFVYNNNSRQQTEACEDLHCPWCSLNCNRLYTLLKHLKLCHSRFTFTYVPISVGARIDVAINEMYDGSYTGSPHDLISQPTVCAFSRNGPIRRASVTHILVCHPKRPKASLSEFLELDDCEFDGQRPFITGHNRLYHHTTTCLPIYPKEMEIDSEGENDPEWLQNKTMMMIDEFTDVNEGEKELMKMWNLHVMKYGFVGDCQIPLACQMFVKHKGRELLLKNLYRNFVVHMTSLFDFGLVSAVCLYTILQKLQELVGDTGPIRNILKESREAQIDNWSRSGISDKSKTPNIGRKAGNVGNQRRKGAPLTPQCDSTVRRKSICAGETSRKRLVTVNKSDQKSS
ncbi:polycomb protein SUZ12 [Diorhabda carinulata]|uniref:polycomb protein SUZ12 n=1 Tax=Diorhabda sublineata TaxID=1163346 RepID=UPI0024E074BB|nr:polycomb protein SUZ12 [Diorhabda sublineata]XP_057652985.1 polycomb protein SUZ12 [Diorhabda carinulata]